MNLNKSTISAAWVALTRRLSYFLPRVHTVGGDEFEAVCERCRESYRRWGHCEIPYPVGDMRRQVWIDEASQIVGEVLNPIFPNFDSMQKDCLMELLGYKDIEWGEGYEH